MPVVRIDVDALPSTPGAPAAIHRAQGQAGIPATFGRWFAQQLAANPPAARAGTTPAESATSAPSASGSGSQSSVPADANLSRDAAFSTDGSKVARTRDQQSVDAQPGARPSALCAAAQEELSEGPGDAAHRPGPPATSSQTPSVPARPATMQASPRSAAPAPEPAPVHSSRTHPDPSSAPAAASPPATHASTAGATAQPRLHTETTAPPSKSPVFPDAFASGSLRSGTDVVASANIVAPGHDMARSGPAPQTPAASASPHPAIQDARSAAAAETPDRVHSASAHGETSPTGESPLPASPHGAAKPALPAALSGNDVAPAHQQALSMASPGAAPFATSGLTPPSAAAWSVTTAHTIMPSAGAPRSTAVESTARTGSPFERMDAAAPPQVLAGNPQRLSVGVRDPGLGWLEIHTRTSSGEISAALATPSAATHTAISAQLPAIREYLSDQQVHVDHLTSEQFAASAGSRENPSGNQPHTKNARDASPGAAQALLTEQPPDSEGQGLSWIDIRV